MLLLQGRAPKLVLAVALVLTFFIFLHLASFPVLSEWKHPKFHLTDDSPKQDSGLPPLGDLAEPHPADIDELELDVVENEPVILHPTPEEVTPTSSYLPSPTPSSSSDQPGNGLADSAKLPCQSLQGAEDVLVVMRTGATETKDKLPVHLETTFKCFPNLVIFSDYGENFRGYEIHDVLRNIPEEVKNTTKVFQHYQHIQEAGRAGLDPSELSGAVSEETGDGSGKDDNPGWALDKWKFIPMINETFTMYPDKKWYVFVEPDSYLVWSNFLQWLPHLDPNKASYFGSEAMIGDVIFGHGGSVFLLTRPAMEKVAHDFNNRTEELIDFIDHQWAGDGALAKVLKDNGVPLTFTWPQFQGGNPAYTTDWEGAKDNKVLWCSPALSYHHLIPVEVAALFEFEQGWIEDVQERLTERKLPLWHSDEQTLLHHKDTFKLFVQPNLTKERDDWDGKNDWKLESDETHPGTFDLNQCRELCEADVHCMQYTRDSKGCTTFVEGPRGPRMGQFNKGYQSGWMYDRILKWIGERDRCSNGDWTTT